VADYCYCNEVTGVLAHDRFLDHLAELAYLCPHEASRLRELPPHLSGTNGLRLLPAGPSAVGALTAADLRQAQAANLLEALANPTMAARERAQIPSTQSELAVVNAEIEQLRVEPDQIARVVIEEASGTIVMGANVRISTVAIAQGNLTIRVTETIKDGQTVWKRASGDNQ
jgi:hypothetical protein